MAKYSNGLEDSLDLPHSSIRVLEQRYLTKDKNGKLLETGEGMFKRVAKDIASADALYLSEFKEKIKPDISTKEFYELIKDNSDIQKREKEFFEMMRKGYFLPNSPTLMNAGKELQQLSACFVLPIEDSIEEIFETKKHMAIIHKTGGGTGFSWSRLRPNGAYIRSTNGYSPGPISFLFTYNEDGEQITQGGKRRGANMGILRANHPDMLCWARVKREEGVLKNFNLSIAFTDKEMEAIKNNEYILMKDPREGVEYTIENAKRRAEYITYGKGDKFKTSWRLSEDETKIIDTYNNEEIGKVEEGKLYIKAKKLFDAIIDGAWRKGEPGIIFIDEINKHNPTPEIGKIESPNPCGEQPLLPFESCNLGSINLVNMINSEREIDESLLEKTVRSATRFLDNVIDRNKYPLKEIEALTKANRKIGLGVMGFAHMLIKMRISYNSPECIDKAEYVMKFIDDVSKDESRKLAKERGAFPNFEKSVYKNEEPIRNATRTTDAPTGTIGVIAGTSQGIEPIYVIVQKRNVKDTIGENLVDIDGSFEEYLKEKELYDDEMLKKMTEKGLKLDDLFIPKKIKDEIKRLFVTAYEIPYEQHIKIQAAFQKYTNNAVSKTINFPESATREDFANAFLLAHELKCKGLTGYRDKSREKQLLTSVGNLEEKVSMDNPIKPQKIMPSIKIEQETPFGNMYVNISLDPTRNHAPIETFALLGNAGSAELADLEAIGRNTSKWLRSGGKLEKIIKQYIKIGSGAFIPSRSGNVQSIPMGFAKALLKFQIARERYSIKDILTGKIDLDELDKEVSDIIKKDEIKIKKISEQSYMMINSNNSYNIKCPECNSNLSHESGCLICHSCGYSKC